MILIIIKFLYMYVLTYICTHIVIFCTCSVQIQLPVLEEMRSIYSNMCGDDAILMQADVMVEMARLKRGSDDE